MRSIWRTARALALLVPLGGMALVGLTAHAEEDDGTPKPSPAVAVMLEKMRENEILTQEEYEDIYRRQAQFEFEETARSELPGWLRDWTFGGDFRMRFDRIDNGDLDPGEVLVPGRDNVDALGLRASGVDNRFRFRLRLGAEKRLGHGLDFGFRIVTASDSSVGTLFNAGGTSFGTQLDSNYRSANVDAGDFFSFKNLFVDRMYLRWAPEFAPAVSVSLGKIANPFRSRDFSTDFMVFDPDIQPEGVAIDYRFDVSPERAWLDLTGGVFLVEQLGSVTIAPAPGDPNGFVTTDPQRDDGSTWLYGIQGGVHGRPTETVQLGARAAFYSLDDITQGVAAALLDLGNGGDAIDDNPLFVLLGPDNDLFQSGRSEGRINELVVDAYADFTPWGEKFRITPFFQWTTLLTADSEDQGFSIGADLGTPEFLQLTVMWARLERNGTIALFTDSEMFGGFTNAKGWYVSLQRQLLPHVRLRGSFFHSEQLDDDCEAASGGGSLALCDTASQIGEVGQFRKTTLDRTRWQADLVVEF